MSGTGKEEWNGEACQRVRDSETLRGEGGERKVFNVYIVIGIVFLSRLTFLLCLIQDARDFNRLCDICSLNYL